MSTVLLVQRYCSGCGRRVATDALMLGFGAIALMSLALVKKWLCGTDERIVCGVCRERGVVAGIDERQS